MNAPNHSTRTPTHRGTCITCGLVVYGREITSDDALTNAMLMGRDVLLSLPTPNPWGPPVSMCAHATHDDGQPVWVTVQDMTPLPVEPDHGAGWCPVHGRRPIEDRFVDGEHTPRGEVAYTVTVLSCGCAQAGPETLVGPSPGDPWAGVTGYRNLRDLARRRRCAL